jgi:hypothetical protein
MQWLTADRARMAFGFCILGILGMLAASIALGHVEERTSYGLMPILTSLATLAGAFAQWAFATPRTTPPNAEPRDGAGAVEGVKGEAIPAVTEK